MWSPTYTWITIGIGAGVVLGGVLYTTHKIHSPTKVDSIDEFNVFDDKDRKYQGGKKRNNTKKNKKQKK